MPYRGYQAPCLIDKFGCFHKRANWSDEQRLRLGWWRRGGNWIRTVPIALLTAISVRHSIATLADTYFLLIIEPFFSTGVPKNSPGKDLSAQGVQGFIHSTPKPNARASQLARYLEIERVTGDRGSTFSTRNAQHLPMGV